MWWAVALSKSCRLSKTVGVQTNLYLIRLLSDRWANADGDPAADGFFLNSWSLQQERVDKASSRTAQMKE